MQKYTEPIVKTMQWLRSYEVSKADERQSGEER